MRVLRESSEDEMVACFLAGELTSQRFGARIRESLVACGHDEELLTRPDLTDERAARARRALLGTLRGYGENREVFENFPPRVHWVSALLAPEELARARYIDYSYWVELSGASRLPADAAKRIADGKQAFGVSNQGFFDAAHALARGERFAPLILVGRRRDRLVCLEGHLRLTAHALAGFPVEVGCLVGTARTMGRWAK